MLLEKKTGMSYDVVVVGRGLMGAATAKHLSSQGYAVALVGPDEPTHRQSHRGIFASHYDEGRITRILDPDLPWAQLAQRAIGRYRTLEAQTGIAFYHEVGHLAVGESVGTSAAYLGALERTAEKLGVERVYLDERALGAHFPYFHLAQSAVGFYQPRQAGYISPRAHVAAQSQAVELNGGHLIREIAHAIHIGDRPITVETQTTSLEARASIVATGGFTQAWQLLPSHLPLTIQGHTILLAQVREATLPALSGMPTLIHRLSAPAQRFYVLPPIQYPDGGWYVKIGCPDTTLLSGDLATLQGWFKGSGNPKTAEHLQRRLQSLLPEIPFVSLQAASCVTLIPRAAIPSLTG